MDRNLHVLVPALGLACALALPAAHGATESLDSGPVRLVHNIATGSTNQVASVAFGAGVRSCAQRINLVTNFLSTGTQSSALLFLPDRDPDNSMVSASMEVKTKGAARIYASATFSPNTASGCAAEYETVRYFDESCDAVVAKEHKGATPSGTLGDEIEILTIGPAARVFLIRATKKSCISIKKEVVK